MCFLDTHIRKISLTELEKRVSVWIQITYLINSFLYNQVNVTVEFKDITNDEFEEEIMYLLMMLLECQILYYRYQPRRMHIHQETLRIRSMISIKIQRRYYQANQKYLQIFREARYWQFVTESMYWKQIVVDRVHILKRNQKLVTEL